MGLPNANRGKYPADVYAQRRTALVAALQARRIGAHAASGFNVWIPVDDEARIVSALRDQGWAVAAGERFRFRSPPGIRVTCSTLAPSDSNRFSDDLAAVLGHDAIPAG